MKKNTGEELARTVQSRFLEFTLRRVKLKMDRKSRTITVAGSGEKLACQVGDNSVTGNPKKAGCAGVGQTFVWDRADSSYCPLHFVQRIKGFLSGQTFVSPQHMVAFTVTQRRADAVTCPGLWQATDTKNIYVSADSGASRRLPRVAGAELDPFLALLMTKKYLAATQVHLPDPARTDDKIKCLERLTAKGDQEPFQVGHDHFAVISGDIVQVFQCRRLKVTLRSTQNCYQDIPVNHPRWQFLNLRNRVAKEISPEVPCRDHFPIRVQGLYHWWALNGGVTRAETPARWTGTPSSRSSSTIVGGLYTQSELDEWEAVQAMPVYFSQLEGSIRLKSCTSSMGCPQPTQAGNYDWSKLEAELPVTSFMANLNEAWTWIGRVDQALVIVFVPLLIVLLVKVRRLENAAAANQGAVNVAVSAPAMIPMQTMPTEPVRKPLVGLPPPSGDRSDPLYNLAFH